MSIFDKLKGLFTSTSATPAPSTGLLGANLPSVQETNGLFTFFNFAPIGKEALSGQRVATAFKPTGEAFRQLVTFYVTTDAKGNIQVLRLVVVRSFIDNPGTWDRSIPVPRTRSPCWRGRSMPGPWANRACR
jgi:hypothetical protein